MNHKKARVLIVDDTPVNIKTLSAALKEDYQLFVATNGFEALSILEAGNLPDLILLDVMMPGMDGYEVCRRIKSDKSTESLPIIFITAMHEESDETKGFELGAVDYIIKPFSIPVVQKRVAMHIQLKQYKDYLEAMVREQTKIIEEEKNLAIKLKTKAEIHLEQFLLTLASAIESKDHYTGGHVERVANYSREIAKKLGFEEERLREIYLAAIVHDVGKIGVRDAVLNKPDRLTLEEFEEIKKHTTVGYKLLYKIEDIEIAAIVALNHQEKWDGRGYPNGLQGEKIPIEARIVTIADVWDAIITDRPYRKAMSLDRALAVMHDERGKSFDPTLLDIFLNEGDKIYLMHQKAD